MQANNAAGKNQRAAGSLQRFFEVEELDLHMQGSPETYTRSLVATRQASGVLLHKLDTDSIILIKQHRIGAIDQLDPYVIEIPAGVFDNGEDAETCTKRELIEETGYEVLTLQKIGSFYASPGYTNEKINLFYSTTNGRHKVHNGGGLASEQENIEIIEVPLEKAFQMIESGEICDSKTAIALLWLYKAKNKV